MPMCRRLFALPGLLLCCCVLQALEPKPSVPVGQPFEPPALPAAPRVIGASKWTQNAGPDETMVIAGYGFDTRTSFQVFGQSTSGKVTKNATVHSITPFRAMITLPAALPKNTVYFVWARNAKGASEPIPVNKAEVWYSMPRQASPGERLFVYGRNLAFEGVSPGWVYVKPKDKAVKGVLLKTENTNPYRAEVVLPKNLAYGDYEVWAHNGHGGRHGWSALHEQVAGVVVTPHLKVRAPHKWDGPTLNVKTLGARGDGRTDDTAAVLKALTKANTTKNTTIYFPAGTYLLSKPISPVTGPDSTGMRIMGDGMKKTFIKGNPKNLPPSLMYIDGGNVEIRDLVLDINYLGETTKLYRDAKRPKHDPAKYAALQKVKDRRDAEKAAARHAENQRKRKLKAWKKKKENRGKPIPRELQPPPKKKKTKKTKGPKPKRPAYLIKKEKWTKGGVRIINCVLDAERWRIFLSQGMGDSLIENCDIVSRECILGCPSYSRINKCNFYTRADGGVMMYLYGGWCIAVTNCTGQDYKAHTYDTAMGRFFTVSAYGNRPENYYIAGNQTFDLTVQPMHYNQNCGEQIMWEFIDKISVQKPTAVGDKSITFSQPIKSKKKINWYGTVVVTAGKGLGQYYQVNKYDKKTGVITLMQPWKVKPDTSSTILLCHSVNRTVVHKNRLDAKPRAYQWDKHIASCGVEPFGGSNELIVDGNRFHELRSGIHSFGHPTYFHLYQNNEFAPGRWGVNIPPGSASLGVICRRNTFKGILENAFTAGSRYGKGAIGSVAAFEHNVVESTPTGVKIGNPRNQSGTESILLYKNRFKLGTAPKAGAAAVKAANPKMVIDRANSVEGYPQKIQVLSK